MRAVVVYLLYWGGRRSATDGYGLGNSLPSFRLREVIKLYFIQCYSQPQVSTLLNRTVSMPVLTSSFSVSQVSRDLRF